MSAKKSLGQHFLTSRAVVSDITGAGDIEKDDVVLEIGPGKGVLTESLLGSGAHVIAVELDPELIQHLQNRFEKNINTGQLTLVQQDVLSFDFADVAEGYKVIANIPYYITGKILRYILTTENKPTRMVLLVQKEVAQRIAATDGKESVLSISVKAFGDPRVLRKVSKRYFTPPPKVDSAVLVIENISGDYFSNLDEKAYFGFIKACFASRRKQLVNTLPTELPKDDVISRLEELGFDPQVRAEDIPFEKWKKMFYTFGR